MASKPRRDVVDPTEVMIYHCYNCCAHQAFLLADADGSSERLRWLRSLEEMLAALFAIEVAFHAELDNHFHLILRSRPDVVEKLSDEEVVRRWLIIAKLKRKGSSEIEEPTAKRLQSQLQITDRVPTLRRRLAHISWFMGTLSENLSRRINQADGTHGTAWASRYQSKPLRDEASLLIGSLYVDLNLIRAGKATTPEESVHTSAYDRLVSLLEEATPAHAGTTSWRADGWLAELTIDPTRPVHAPEFFVSATGRRASDKGLLEMPLTAYLELLDWTGRQIRGDKRGAIPASLAPILERLGLDGDRLVEAIVHPPRSLVDARFQRQLGTLSG